MPLQMNFKQFILLAIKRRLLQVNDVTTAGLIHPGAWISGSIISGEVTIAKGCKIFQAELSGVIDVDRFTTIWGPGVLIDGKKHGIQVGSFCSIAHHVSMHESFHDVQRTTTYFIEKNLFHSGRPFEAEVSRGAIIIGNDVWIGAGVTILSGVQIGDGAVIGAGSVVTRDIPPYVIAAGNPANVVRERFPPEVSKQIADTQWWSWSEDRLRSEYKFLTNRHVRG